MFRAWNDRLKELLNIYSCRSQYSPACRGKFLVARNLYMRQHTISSQRSMYIDCILCLWSYVVSLVWKSWHWLHNVSLAFCAIAISTDRRSMARPIVRLLYLYQPTSPRLTNHIRSWSLQRHPTRPETSLKKYVFFQVMSPIDNWSSPLWCVRPTQVRHGSMRKISPPYFAPFYRRSQTTGLRRLSII